MKARELATVLAALRHWQTYVVLPALGSKNWKQEVGAAAPEHFAEHSPLDSTEIDNLCERLNAGSPEQVHLVVAEDPEEGIEAHFYEAHRSKKEAKAALKRLQREHPELEAALLELELLD